ncbi:MAG: Uma2 family endonuclease [Acidobacteriota bacterium]|jgi:Uma2 family endonuclease|nr:Uma2 family endonuclease [Acidobacteriota bacterium]MDQ3372300.1 Uma2 family endonuclease [Acidobacteriota bacterium]
MDLAVKWQELINNPFFRDIPYKVELNKYGTILMSPASNRHGILQYKIGRKIEIAKKRGIVIVECSILTGEGVRVADVAWASDEFFAEFGDKTPYPKAPEICVEVISPGNSQAEIEEKIRLYLEKGALEVWIVSEHDQINFFTHTGEIKVSKVVENFV